MRITRRVCGGFINADCIINSSNLSEYTVLYIKHNKKRYNRIVQNQKVTHRMFAPGGGINGIPIMP